MDTMNLGGYYPPPPNIISLNPYYPSYGRQNRHEFYVQGPRHVHLYNPYSPGTFATEVPNQNRNENGNPCNCCCDLIPAARILAILNMLYLIIELIDLFAPESPFFWGRSSSYSYNYYNKHNDKDGKGYSDPFEESGSQLFYNCMKYQADEAGPLYTLVTILFASSIVAYILATLGFIVDVFAGAGDGSDLYCSNTFTVISFIYPGWLAHIFLFLNALVLKSKCAGSSHLWTKHIFGAVVIAVFSMFNGFVGRAFKMMTERQRRHWPPEVPQGIGGEVSATSTTSAGEPLPNQY